MPAVSPPSLYPCSTGWKWLARGRWSEKAGRAGGAVPLTTEGRKVLAAQRGGWQVFARAVSRIAGVET